MAVAPRPDDDEAAAMLAAELANLSFSSTATLRGGSRPGSRPDGARSRQLANYMDRPRRELPPVPKPLPSAPSSKLFYVLIAACSPSSCIKRTEHS